MINSWSAVSFLVLIAILGCGHAKTPEEYYRYCLQPENGLVKQANAGSFTGTLQYLSASLLAYNEVEKPAHQAAFDSLVKQYGQSMSFKLTLSDSSLPPAKQLEQRYNGTVPDSITQYLNFRMNRCFYLNYGVDTLPCSFSLMEQAGHVKPTITFLLGFDLSVQVMDSLPLFNLLWKDSVFTGGNFHWTFQTKDIQKIPALKF